MTRGIYHRIISNRLARRNLTFVAFRPFINIIPLNWLVRLCEVYYGGKNVKPSINLILHALETDSRIGKERKERDNNWVDSGTKIRRLKNLRGREYERRRKSKTGSQSLKFNTERA